MWASTAEEAALAPGSLQAHHAFFLAHCSRFISNSVGAHVVFCPALVSWVARALGNRAVRALEQQERFSDALNIGMR